MARDFEDLHDVDNMSPADLEAFVREQLEEYRDIDPSRVEIEATGRGIRLAGRVGTEAEYQAVEHVLTDVLGIADVVNEMVVDPLTRAEHDDAADVANAEVYDRPRGQRGGADRTEDTAAHLLDDTGAEQYGTGDVGEAVERGLSYNPPDTPVQEGHEGREEH
jgi:hypothetical protein